MTDRDNILSEVNGWLQRNRLFLQKDKNDWSSIKAEQLEWSKIFKDKKKPPVYFFIYMFDNFNSKINEIIYWTLRNSFKLRGTPLQLAALEVRNCDILDCAAALARGTTIENEALDDPLIFDASCRIVASLLAAGATLRPGLAEFSASVISGLATRPKHHGRHSREIALRDTGICFLINMVMSRGFKATRFEDTGHKNSACDIVAEALAAAGLNPTRYETLKQVWRKRRRSFYENDPAKIFGEWPLK
jgi:hypothetical protein